MTRTTSFTTRRRSYNSYLRGGRTYARLYAYYLPVGYYNRRGYYSYYYSKTYYDGYGYNFYSGGYGYYESYRSSYGPPSPLGGIVGGIIVLLCCVMCCCWHCRGGKGEEIDIEESVYSEEEEVIETVEVVEHHQPQVYTMGQPMQQPMYGQQPMQPYGGQPMMQQPMYGQPMQMQQPMYA